MIQNEADAILDDILSRFHAWSMTAKAVRGWASKALVCGDFDGYRNQDNGHDDNEQYLEQKIMAAVDFQIGEMAEPHRSAIYCNARNLCTGLAVWSSPRLPADTLARAAIVVEARAVLMRRLVSAGVM